MADKRRRVQTDRYDPSGASSGSSSRSRQPPRQPPQPTPPQFAPLPAPLPLGDRFVDGAAFNRYTQTFNNKLAILERSVDLERVGESFRQNITHRHWEPLTTVPNTRPNLSWVKEFHANLCSTPEDATRVRVRNVSVDISGTAIRAIYGLEEIPPAEGYEMWLEDKLNEDGADIDEEAREQIHSLARFDRGSMGRLDLPTAEENFSYEEYSKFRFIASRLNPTSKLTVIKPAELRLLYAFNLGIPIDVGRRVLNAFHLFRHNQSRRLVFPHLITALCTAAGVPTYGDDDLSLRNHPPIVDRPSQARPRAPRMIPPHVPATPTSAPLPALSDSQLLAQTAQHMYSIAASHRDWHNTQREYDIGLHDMMTALMIDRGLPTAGYTHPPQQPYTYAADLDSFIPSSTPEDFVAPGFGFATDSPARSQQPVPSPVRFPDFGFTYGASSHQPSHSPVHISSSDGSDAADDGADGGYTNPFADYPPF